MTIIAGLIGDNAVHMAADTFSGNPDTYLIKERKDPKLFVSGRAVVGFTTSYRMGQALMYADLFKGKRTLSHRWMVTQFVPKVQQLFAVAGIERSDNGVKSCGEFVIAMGTRLFVVFSDYSVAEPADGFAAIGCGQDFALGSLWSTALGSDDCYADRVRCAVQCAGHHSAFCNGETIYANTKSLHAWQY